MKNYGLVILSMVLFLFLFRCDNSTSSQKANLNTMLIAQHHQNIWNSYGFFPDGVFVRGEIYGEPFPEIFEMSICDSILQPEDYLIDYPGYIRIAPELMLIKNISPLEVKIETSIGNIKGKIQEPDSIKTLTPSTTDTVKLGESLTFSWDCKDADFYGIYLYYFWKENSKIYYNLQVDFTKDKHYTYTSEILNHDGIITSYNVEPCNGPIPKTGVRGNMSGDGSGFLYYLTSGSNNYWNGEIIVGNGSPEPIWQTINKQEIKTKIIDELINKIRGGK